MKIGSRQYKAVIFSGGALLLVLLFYPFATESLWWRQALNSGHTFFFFVLSFALYNQVKNIPKFSERRVAICITIFFCLFLGAAIELIQGYFYDVLQREGSIDDFYNDIYGMVSGLALAAVRRQEIVRQKLLFGLIGAFFLMLGSYSLIQISWHGFQRANALPLVTQFHESWMTSFVRLQQVEMTGVITKQGRKWYQMRFDKSKYPGIDIIEPVADWSAYKEIGFEVWSNNENDVSLTLRIHDDKHNQEYSDRFNRRFIIKPGMNSISVNLLDVKHSPKNRELNMNSVSGMKVFMVDVKESTFLDMSNIYFE